MNTLNINIKNEVIIASFVGVDYFNNQNYIIIKDQIEEIVKNHNTTLILDFSNIIHFDASTFCALTINLRTAKRHNSKFILTNLSDRLTEVVKVMNLNRVFTIYSTVDEFFEI